MVEPNHQDLAVPIARVEEQIKALVDVIRIIVYWE